MNLGPLPADSVTFREEGAAVEMWPTLPVPNSANQRLLSEPVTMPSGTLPAGSGTSGKSEPAGETWPILLDEKSVYQRLPSGPVVMPTGPLPAGGRRPRGRASRRARHGRSCWCRTR